jgi:hypothetical protein
MGAFALFAAHACGGEDASSAPTGGTGGSGAGGGGLDGAVIDVARPDGLTPDAACGVVQESAEITPLHLYVMMDKSSSMAGNQWQSAVAGLSAFVGDPSSAGIDIALKFFPREPSATPACDQKAYATPSVAYGLLPGNASAIQAALSAESPNGLSTPTWPALGGALLKSIEVLQNNPGDSAAVLLVTDGVPQGPAPLCGGVDPADWNEISSLAQSALGFGVPTYVIGLPGVDQSFANQVAQAGGTTSAILVSNVNVEQEFQNALSKVRGQALSCEYVLPAKVEKGEIAFNKVNVVITPGGGAPMTLLQTPDCNQAPGWYYDNPSQPTKILLCPSVCDGLKQDFQAKVEILLGCATKTVT